MRLLTIYSNGSDQIFGQTIDGVVLLHYKSKKTKEELIDLMVSRSKSPTEQMRMRTSYEAATWIKVD